MSVLTVAGLDPSGGAGIAADLAAFAAFGCHGMAVSAALTVQDTADVAEVLPVTPRVLEAQIAALLADCPPQAAKCGLLASAESVRIVARAWRKAAAVPLVVDPVARSGSGTSLAGDETLRETVDRLFPLAALVTPNADEAEALTGIAARDPAGAEAAGRRIVALGAAAALVKGGHAARGTASDVLVERGRPEARVFERPRIATPRRVHGTGCALSAAVAAGLARGLPLAAAVELAGRWVHAAIGRAHVLGAGALVLDFSARVPGMPA